MDNRRSLNLEAVACLEALVQSAPVDTDALLAHVREIRRTPARTRLTEFVALAQDLRVPFVTANRQLAAFPSTAVSPADFLA